MPLSQEAISGYVERLRREPIVGHCYDLVPYSAQHDEQVVALRRLPNVRHFMNLIDEPTLDSQRSWRLGYEQRNNDVMWVICDKSGQVCGTNRLYDITPSSAEKGSLIVDPDLARGGPSALEAEIQIINLAFGVLLVDFMITTVKAGNTNMISMNKRFGFSYLNDLEIRGEVFSQYKLFRESWNPEPYEATLRHWSRRLL